MQFLVSCYKRFTDLCFYYFFPGLQVNLLHGLKSLSHPDAILQSKENLKKKASISWNTRLLFSFFNSLETLLYIYIYCRLFFAIYKVSSLKGMFMETAGWILAYWLTNIEINPKNPAVLSF